MTNALNAPAYPIVAQKNLRKFVPQGNTQNASFVVTNKGGAAAIDVYAKINLIGGFTTSIDSFYIGQLAVAQSRLLNISITAPNIDTIGGYELILYGANNILPVF